MTLVKVDPFRCRVWDMHDRLGESVDARTCASLMASIKKHGQLQPVLARRAASANGADIELIYGARRLFVAQQLRIELVVELREIDDRTGLVEMDAENRVRSDISPYERGISYRRWLAAGFFKSQVDIARGLGISEARVSRLLRYADLPAVVVEAFARPIDIQEDWAVALANQCRDDHSKRLLIQRARQLKTQRPESPRAVYVRLSGMYRNPGRRLAAFREQVVKDAAGRQLFRASFRSRSVHLIFQRDVLTNDDLRGVVQGVTDILVRSGTRDAVPRPRAPASAESGPCDDSRIVEPERSTVAAINVLLGCAKSPRA